MYLCVYLCVHILGIDKYPTAVGSQWWGCVSGGKGGGRDKRILGASPLAFGQPSAPQDSCTPSGKVRKTQHSAQ